MSNLVIRNNRSPLGVWGDLDRVMDAVFGDLDSGFTRGRFPAVDVEENENSYVLKADIPGLSEKDVEIKIDDQLLTISSKTEENKEEKKNGWLIRERRGASFSRSFSLPAEVDREAIKASAAEGVLTIELPKQEKAKPRVITINKK